jgi:hypothetical protein
VSQVHTHESACAVIRDVVEMHGGEFVRHIFESTKAEGKVMISKGQLHQSIRYHLPDDEDDLRKYAVTVFDPKARWGG